MKIKTIVTGAIEENCYILIDEATNKAAIIDPGDNAEKILSEISGLEVAYILLTHGHYDHIGAVDEIREKTKATVCMHKLEGDCLTNASSNLSGLLGKSVTMAAADVLLSDGDIIGLGELTIHVLHTPGHTIGGVSYLVQDVVFVGDTIFLESVGRVDLPGGNFQELAGSIKNKLYVLDNKTTLYSGHGNKTTVGHEKKYNVYIRQ